MWYSDAVSHVTLMLSHVPNEQSIYPIYSTQTSVCKVVCMVTSLYVNQTSSMGVLYTSLYTRTLHISLLRSFVLLHELSKKNSDIRLVYIYDF